MLKRNDREEDVRTLQENLVKLGYKPGKVDGVFGEKTEQALIQFQEAEGLYADGIFGPRTLEVMERALQELVLELGSPGTDSMAESSERLPFVRVEADSYKDGYDRFYLRADVAKAYLKVRETIVSAGGKITSSGGRRVLTARVNPNRSVTSFHYTGRALDLHVGSGMERPGTDPFVIAKDGDRLWRVYARAPEGEAMEIDAITYRSRKRPRKVEGNFLDVTALFEEQGFHRIKARKSFFDSGIWLGAEWWHFQYEKELEPEVSTFGNELLRVYTEETLRPTPPWKHRDRVFKVNWW